MKFRRRPGARTAQGTTTPTPAAAGAEQSLRDAQQIVRRAWELELLRQRDHLRFAVRAAYQDCDTARRRLATAQRDGAAETISAAHGALEQALEDARTSALAYAKVRSTLRIERNLLSRVAKQDAAKALSRPPERDRSARTTQPPETPGQPVRQARRVLRAPRLRRRLPRWLSHSRLAVHRAVGLEQL